MSALATLASMYSTVDRVYDHLLGKSVSRWTLSLPGAGCTWGKCTMCAFKDAARAYSFGLCYPKAVMLGLVRLAYSQIAGFNPEILRVFNAGSWWADTEIRTSAQQALFKFGANIPTLQVVETESRAKFVSALKINEALSLLAGKTLRVAIGLEVANENYRQIVVRKGMANAEFERAVSLLKQYGAQARAYVFIGLPGQTEKEMIDMAVEAARYAFDVGVDIITLEALGVQPNTPVHKLFKQGKIEPPRLWTIVETLNRASKFGPVTIGNFLSFEDDLPRPVAIPTNCTLCSAQVREILMQFRTDGNFSVLLDKLPSCDCLGEWKDLLEQSPEKSLLWRGIELLS